MLFVRANLLNALTYCSATNSDAAFLPSFCVNLQMNLDEIYYLISGIMTSKYTKRIAYALEIILSPFARASAIANIAVASPFA